MSQAASNLRIRRTQKLLRDALVELIEERDFDSLTVSEITERALVSRAAFYRNYHDKYDLVEKIFAEAIGKLLNAVGGLGQEHPAEIWVAFFEHIASYERLYHALLGSKGSPWFVWKMRAALRDLVIEQGRRPPRPGAGAHAAHAFADGFVPDIASTLFVEAITWWLDHGRPYTPREIATRTSLLAAALFKEAATWQ